MNESIGLGGYASLLKTQKNPHERNLAATMNVINSMPKDGGVTGLEGIGKLPLMLQAGVDSAAAQQFDEARAQKEDEYAVGAMKYQQEKDALARRDKVFANYIKLAQVDPNAANTYATEDPDAKQVVPHGMQIVAKPDKNGWLAVKELSADGTQETSYQLNLGGLPEAAKVLKAQGIVRPTVTQIAEAMPPGWAIKTVGAAKATDAEDKPTSQVQKDPESPTGWSYISEKGNLYPGAPDPHKGKTSIHVSGGGGESGEEKGFNKWSTKLQAIQGRIASIKKGYDPLTGQAVPQTNIDAAIAQLQPELENTARYMRSKFPNESRTYFGGGSSNNSGNSGLPHNLPQGATNVTKRNGKIYFQKDGVWFEKRNY